MTFRRVVYLDGWGVQIVPRPNCSLNFHHVQKPELYLIRTIDAFDWERGTGFDLYARSGRMSGNRYWIGRQPTPWFVERDVMPLYRMLQRARIDNGPAEPIIDWLIELDVPHITEFLT